MTATYGDFAQWRADHPQATVGDACRAFPTVPLETLTRWFEQHSEAAATVTIIPAGKHRGADPAAGPFPYDPGLGTAVPLPPALDRVLQEHCGPQGLSQEFRRAVAAALGDWAWVKLADAAQTVWWACADRTAAERFAGFVTAEIDPAEVTPGPPPPGAVIHDPVHELLAWWDICRGPAPGATADRLLAHAEQLCAELGVTLQRAKDAP